MSDNDFELIITNNGDTPVDVDLHVGVSHQRYTVPARKISTVRATLYARSGCALMLMVPVLMGMLVAVL